MAFINLSGGFSMITEGEHVFKITKVSYNEDFGKLKITMMNHDGKKHFENLNLLTVDGQPNSTTLNILSVIARKAMRDPSLETIDPQDMVGHYIKGTINYREYIANDGKTKRTTEHTKGTYWEEVAPEEEAAFSCGVRNEESEPLPDIMSILGRR